MRIRMILPVMIIHGLVPAGIFFNSVSCLNILARTQSLLSLHRVEMVFELFQKLWEGCV